MPPLQDLMQPGQEVPRGLLSLIQGGANYVAPNALSLLTGDAAPPLPNVPEMPGKVPSTQDPRLFGAVAEAANVGQNFIPQGGTAKLGGGVLAALMGAGARKGLMKAPEALSGEILPPAASTALPGVTNLQRAKLGPMLEQLEKLGATPEQIRTFTPVEAYKWIRDRQGAAVEAAAPDPFPNSPQGIKAYHVTRGDFDKFGPAPEYRGATYFAQTPEGAHKGAAGGAQDFYSTPGPAKPIRTIEANIPDEGISGLHWTPEEMRWHEGLPQHVVGDDAVNAALANQPNYRSIPWDDIYEMKPLGDGTYEYIKKPPKTYSWDEASKTRRDIYGRQLPTYSSGSDRASAKRLREQGMKGFLVGDEAGVSIAHIDPEIIDILKKYGLAGTAGPLAGLMYGQQTD
jgi:hypothetical protein